ncbi:MAG: Zn-ribbon domain-containing OB-fold protein [Chloroflexi bacterium]|nr:Zn-ribbon domain-containing OB-fold protein [Chloroflexota bacterium]
MSEYQKPIPEPDFDSLRFWEECRNHHLVLQRCGQCQRFRYFPRAICPTCMSDQYEWEPVSGRGSVYTYSVVERPPSPEFAADVPYVVALVELAEGPRMTSNVVGCSPREVRIGMPVEVTFDDVTPYCTLPRFRPLAEGGR